MSMRAMHEPAVIRTYLILMAAATMAFAVACGGGDEDSTPEGDAALDGALFAEAGTAEVDAGVDAGPPPPPVDAGGPPPQVDSGPPPGRCGDAQLDADEECDDGNQEDGDGCDADCMEEEGFNCVVAGAACEECGNRVVESAEECDDGNRDNDDGCDENCAMEEGNWSCPVPGEPCELCGDGVIDANERCDEGDYADGLGCSDDCRSIDEHFACPVAGEPCYECGDGSVDGDEICDDGNTESGDGCVFNCSAVEPGWLCPDGGGDCTLCGDGTLQDATEECDDGNFQSGDGCSATCEIEPGATCMIAGVLCSVCGNGFIEYTTYLGDNDTPDDPSDDFADPEECDDGNQDDDDGCSSDCEIEDGGDLPWLCPVPGLECGRCGDGVVQAIEACDDGDQEDGDGCSADCTAIEPHFWCPEDGGACVECGDGALDDSVEECDDGNVLSGDGCNRLCELETIVPWVCPVPGEPCELCGNGFQEANEACDDGNLEDGDGCSADCQAIEDNYNCFFQGFPCAECGDGVINVGETCDEGHLAAPENATDGCNDLCQIVEPWICPVAGAACEYCGDSIVDAYETCDDGNRANEDGCDSSCQVEFGYDCSGDSCVAAACGDGFVAGDEECDDGNLLSGDGCNIVCDVEEGFSCEGSEGCRRTVCGDAIVEGDEQCDNGSVCTDTDSGTLDDTDCTAEEDEAACLADNGTCDPFAITGCDELCQLEIGYVCPSPGEACEETVCGDAIVEGAEQCDDGRVCTDTDSGDLDDTDCSAEEDEAACLADNGTCGPPATPGCDEQCQLEPGYHCPNPGEACEPTVCGDGLVQGLEACDDGKLCTDTDSGDLDNTDCTAEVDETACLADNGICDVAASDGCATDCTVETFYRCSGEPSQCRPIIGFVSVLSFNISNIDPAGLVYDPSRRSFAGHKKAAAELDSIELCLDGTVVNPNDGTEGDDGTIIALNGDTFPLDPRCADVTPGDPCYDPPIRPEGTNNMFGAGYDPFTDSFLYLNEEAGSIILTQIPRDFPGGSVDNYDVTLGDGAEGDLDKADGITVGEDGNLYVVLAADQEVWVYPRRWDEETGMVYIPDCASVPETNCTSFGADPIAAWGMPSGDPLDAIFAVPGERLLGTFNKPLPEVEYPEYSSIDESGTEIDSSEYFRFYDPMLGGDRLYGSSELPGLLFDAGATGHGYTQEAKAAETAADGGAFVICVKAGDQACQLFARICESDADCPPGTICNLDGVDTVGVPYCHAPGDARDDRYEVARDDVGETKWEVLDVLANDALSESACIDPTLTIVAVCGDGVDQQYELDNPDNCTDEPITRGTVELDGGGDFINYDAPDDQSCGFIDTFRYTAHLGGGVHDTATVRVIVACECGDGTVDANEQCDDGADNGIPGAVIDDGGTPEDPSDDVYARCSPECLLNVLCGDNHIVAPEECDDGNVESGDGCSPVCTLETVCGDGFEDGAEECDDGSECTDGADCTGDASVCAGLDDETCEPRGGDGCNANCTVPRCGDGHLDLDNPVVDEQCDDGNTNPADRCSNDCQLVTVCGDGVVEGQEVCDDGNTISGDGCSALCTLDNICGNGIADGGEVCDGDDFGDCPSIDSTQIMCINQPEGAPNICLCQNYCGDDTIGGIEECDDGMEGSETCRGADPDDGDPCTEIRCGDGITDTDAGEECDDGNTNPADECTNDCRLVAVCGDGEVQGSEECDDGNNVSGDGCSSACQEETTVCGDGVLDYNEQCDDGNTDPGDGCDASCLIEAGSCGNGEIDPGEQCDDGNTVSGDDCSADCQSELCGNGVIDFEEHCDDGNTVSGDGCSATCRVEIE